MGIDFQKPAPLYRQIIDDIKAQIAAEKLKVNDALGSHQQLAEHYQVSLITVKKALSELINEGYLYSRVGKGTFVADKTRFIIRSKHKTLGIVLNDIKNPFFSLIVHRFEQRAYDLGYNILLSTSSNLAEKEEIQIRRFRELGVDGLLIASLSRLYRATPAIQQLHRDNFPYVTVSFIEDEGIYFVGTDHEKGAYIATAHLIDLGHKHIGYVNAEEGNLLGEHRKRGYLRALGDHNLPVNEDLIFYSRRGEGVDDFMAGYQIGKAFKTFVVRPDALFFYNDLTALGFERAVLEQGLRIPDDIAIVGFDNIKRGNVAPVPLTTIAQPTQEIGEIAFDIISKRIAGADVPTRTILRPTLIVRASCGAKTHQGMPFPEMPLQ